LGAALFGAAFFLLELLVSALVPAFALGLLAFEEARLDLEEAGSFSPRESAGADLVFRERDALVLLVLFAFEVEGVDEVELGSGFGPDSSFPECKFSVSSDMWITAGLMVPVRVQWVWKFQIRPGGSDLLGWSSGIVELNVEGNGNIAGQNLWGDASRGRGGLCRCRGGLPGH